MFINEKVFTEYETAIAKINGFAVQVEAIRSKVAAHKKEIADIKIQIDLAQDKISGGLQNGDIDAFNAAMAKVKKLKGDIAAKEKTGGQLAKHLCDLQKEIDTYQQEFGSFLGEFQVGLRKYNDLLLSTPKPVNQLTNYALSIGHLQAELME